MKSENNLEEKKINNRASLKPRSATLRGYTRGKSNLIFNRKSKISQFWCQFDPFLAEVIKRPDPSPSRLIFTFIHDNFKMSSKPPPLFKKRQMKQSEIQRILIALRQLPTYMPRENFCLKAALIFIATFAFVVGLLSYGVPYSQGKELGFSPLFVGLITIAVVFLLIFFFNYLINSFYIRLLNKRESDFKKMLDIQNKLYFYAKGVMWRTGKYGAWLELNFDISKVERYKIMNLKKSDASNRRRKGRTTHFKGGENFGVRVEKFIR